MYNWGLQIWGLGGAGPPGSASVTLPCQSLYLCLKIQSFTDPQPMSRDGRYPFSLKPSTQSAWTLQIIVLNNFSNKKKLQFTEVIDPV